MPHEEIMKMRYNVLLIALELINAKKQATLDDLPTILETQDKLWHFVYTRF